MLFATAARNFGASDVWKVLRNWRVLYMFTSKCAFRHSGVHFFDIWTSKSAPKLTCFVHFDSTAACNFSTAELQKVLRHLQFLRIFTSKCAFRHSGAQFLMSPLSTYLRTRRFNRPTFRLTRHTNHWKNTAFRDVSNIWRGCVFFLLTFVLVHLLPSDLTACLICFSTLHIVGSLLFKLPSIINHNNMNTHCEICIFNTSPWSIFGPQPNLLPIGGMESQAPFKSCFLRGFLVTRCDGPIVEIHLAHRRSSNVYEAESTWDEAISKGWDWGKLIYRCNENSWSLNANC